MSQLRIGQTVNQYTIRSQLGDGGYAKVFMIEDNTSHEKSAMKTLDKCPSWRNKSALDEIACLRALRHVKGVPTLKETFDLPTCKCIVMSLDLADLDNVFRRSSGFFEQKSAMKIVYLLVEILESAHRAKFLHRDVKMANVMIVEDYRSRYPIRLIDWGVAKKMTKTYKTSSRDTLFKNINYVSPHMALGRSASKRCDLVMCLYVGMQLSGSWPFGEFSDTKCTESKMKFDENPKKTKGVARYFIPIAEEIFKYKEDRTPDYKSIKQVIATSKRGFDPITYHLPITKSSRGTVTIKH